MFKWMARFTRSPSSPPGMERQILRQLPLTLVLGSAAIALPSLILRAATLVRPALAPATLIQTTDYLAIAVLLVHVTAVVTVGIGAFVVVVMKGPVHSADSYPLSDAEQPPPRQEDTRQ